MGETFRNPRRGSDPFRTPHGQVAVILSAAYRLCPSRGTVAAGKALELLDRHLKIVHRQGRGERGDLRGTRSRNGKWTACCSLGKPGRFGTQFQKDAAGKWLPKKLEDPGHADERRAVGLESLADYTLRMSEVCDGK